MVNNVHLQERESVFWNVSGPINFIGSGSMLGGIISLGSEQDVNFLGFPQAPIISRAGDTYLKSFQTVRLSGRHFYDPDIGSAWPQVYTVSDTLRFKHGTETIFRSARTSLNANTIFHESGAAVTSETDPTDTYGPIYGLLFGLQLEMNARDQIRLSDGFKIKGGHAFLRVSDDLDPFANSWDNILEKPSAETRASVGPPAVFHYRVIQEPGSVSLEYSLPERGPLSVQIFDLKGRLAGSVNVRHPRPGTQTVVIPGQFENGTVYFVKVMANEKAQTHRFVMGL